MMTAWKHVSDVRDHAHNTVKRQSATSTGSSDTVRNAASYWNGWGGEA